MKTRPYLLALLLLAPPSLASANELPSDPEALFTQGQYEAALVGFAAASLREHDDAPYMRGLVGAVRCEMLLGRHPDAFERLRRARLPADVGMRAIVELLRLQLLFELQRGGGISDGNAPPVHGDPPLARADATREADAATLHLWRDRVELARVPIAKLGDLFNVEHADLTRFPSLWDFLVERMSIYLVDRTAGGTIDLTAETVPRDFEHMRPSRDRLAALFEESGNLDGGDVDRKSAAERWRIDRVLLDENHASTDDGTAWRARAIARLSGWARTMTTPAARAEAALQAATFLRYKDQDDGKLNALALIDAALKDSPSGRVATTLRQLAAELGQRELSAWTWVTRDGKGALHVSARNVKTIYLRLYRLDPTSQLQEELGRPAANPQVPAKRIEGWMKTLPKVAEWSVPTGDRGTHASMDRNLDVRVPGVGFYLLLVSTEHDFPVGRATVLADFLQVNDIAVARVRVGETVRHYAFDAERHAPAAEMPFRLQLFPHRSLTLATQERLLTNSDGVVDWTYPVGQDDSVETMAQHGYSFGIFESTSAAHRVSYPQPAPAPPLVLLVATDRPLYRLRDKIRVHVTALVRAVDGGYDFAHDQAVDLDLREPSRGAIVASAKIVMGALGSATAELTLPADSVAGNYSLMASDPAPSSGIYKMLQLRVEDQEPGLDVQLDPPPVGAHYGDKVRIQGHVKDAAGKPAAHVPLTFTVVGERWAPPNSAPPAAGWRVSDLAKKELTHGQLESDGEGAFVIELTAASADPVVHLGVPPGSEPPDVSRLTVDVNARDAGGHRVGRRCELSVGQQPLLLSAEGAGGFFMSNERPQLRVSATRFDEQPLATTVRWTVERLGAPDGKADPIHRHPLAVELARYPALREVAHGTLATIEHEATELQLPATLPAGIYRLRLDGDGGSRGTFPLLVVDARTQTLPGVLPPLALARRDVYRPGETAELLVGGGDAAGTYQLEVWRDGRRLSSQLHRGAPLRIVRLPVDDQIGELTIRWIGVAGASVVSSDVTLTVRRPNPSLVIKLQKPPTLTPGRTASLALEVRDARGKLVDGEALVSVFDDELTPRAPAMSEWRLPPNPAAEKLPRLDVSKPMWTAIYLHNDRVQASVPRAAAPPPNGVTTAWIMPRFAWERPVLTYGYGAIAPGSAVPNARVPEPHWKSPHKGTSPNKADDERAPEPAIEPPMFASGRLGPMPATQLETVAWLPAVALQSGRATVELRLPERPAHWRVRVLALGRDGTVGSIDDELIAR